MFHLSKATCTIRNDSVWVRQVSIVLHGPGRGRAAQFPSRCHLSSQSAMGFSQDSRRVKETRHQSGQVYRRKVHGTGSQANITNLANLPQKSYERVG